MEHHEKTLADFARREIERGAAGVILVGSVARGTERADSDVDVYLIVDEQRFESARQASALAYVERDGVDYPGGYIDVKLVTMEYLETAAERGDDPTRASFVGARPVATTVADAGDTGTAGTAGAAAGIEELIGRITNPPESVWERNAASFMAQVYLYGEYFLPHGERLGDPFLLAHAGTHLALAGARALLARNRVLFRGPKYVSDAIRHLAEVPAGFVDAFDALVRQPGIDAANRVIGLLDELGGWPGDRSTSLSRFVEDNELAWLTRTVPAEYR